MTTQEKIMTTKEVANRLAELCRQDKFEQAQRELFAEDAESLEGEDAVKQGWPAKTKGLNNIFKKGEQWENMVEQKHGTTVSEPLIAGNSFAFVMRMDITMKGQSRMAMDELCVYETKDGKVVREQFFY